MMDGKWHVWEGPGVSPLALGGICDVEYLSGDMDEGRCTSEVAPLFGVCGGKVTLDYGTHDDSILRYRMDPPEKLWAMLVPKSPSWRDDSIRLIEVAKITAQCVFAKTNYSSGSRYHKDTYRLKLFASNALAVEYVTDLRARTGATKAKKLQDEANLADRLYREEVTEYVKTNGFAPVPEKWISK